MRLQVILLALIEDIIKQLFSLGNVVLHGFKDSLLLQKFLVELLLPLIVKV